MKTERFSFMVPGINFSMKNENMWNQQRVLRKGTEKTRSGKYASGYIGRKVGRKRGR